MARWYFRRGHFDDEHDAFKGARSGRLGIGSTPTLLGDVIPDVLKALHRSHPRLVLSVISGNWEALLDRLQRGEIDIRGADDGKSVSRASTTYALL